MCTQLLLWITGLNFKPGCEIWVYNNKAIALFILSMDGWKSLCKLKLSIMSSTVSVQGWLPICSFWPHLGLSLKSHKVGMKTQKWVQTH